MENTKKLKVLVLSDHALSTSGVGTQTRHLIEGLLNKNTWSFRQFGAALKHSDYRTIVINDDFIIKPIDGFGNQELLRVTLATEKPDLLFIFTDPRFFIWLFEMEDEIHQICPIVWWHVWDNAPYPDFNSEFYQSTDKINCHSHMTYNLIKDKFPDKTFFIPHAIPREHFYRFESGKIKKHKSELLGQNRIDDFVGIWVNRNAKRKRPGDVLESWKIFLDDLEKKTGSRKATLIMHTEPTDNEGPNLYKVAENLGIQNHVFFSRERIGFDQMNILYNISDFCINISFAEGFGLSTLEAMMTGTPIIAAKTGGLTRQVVNCDNNTENGVALDIVSKTLVGSQTVPYIYEDYCSIHDAAKAMFKLFSLDEKGKKDLSDKVIKYTEEKFSIEKTVDDWHESMIDAVKNWKEKYIRWDCTEL